MNAGRNDRDGGARDSPREPPPRNAARDGGARDSPREPPARNPARDSPRDTHRSAGRDAGRNDARDSPRDGSRDSERGSRNAGRDNRPTKDARKEPGQRHGDKEGPASNSGAKAPVDEVNLPVHSASVKTGRNKRKVGTRTESIDTVAPKAKAAKVVEVKKAALAPVVPTAKDKFFKLCSTNKVNVKRSMSKVMAAGVNRISIPWTVLVAWVGQA